MAKKLALVNGVPRMVEESASPVIYDESITLASALSTGTPVTLPNSKTYEDDELEVYLNGQRMEVAIDFTYEGTIPRTQISFTFDLEIDDIVRFRIDRSA